MSRARGLTAVQLAWCQKNMPSFAKAYADVCRRDAEVAANRARFEDSAQMPLSNKLYLIDSTDRDGVAA